MNNLEDEKNGKNVKNVKSDDEISSRRSSRLNTAQDMINANNIFVSVAMSDTYEQLADILYRRAQAKLVYTRLEVDKGIQLLHSALDDAVRASDILPADIEYQLLVVSCYLRYTLYIDLYIHIYIYIYACFT
jgi:hypothetical protein